MDSIKIIAVDFDGTLCENKWPEIGEPINRVIEFIKNKQKNGTKIILWTCREGKRLLEAAIWCEKHGLIFDAINESLPESAEKYNGYSRKVYADIYIDDKSINPSMI